MALTNKQQRFIEEYLVDLNATQAAIRAGYSAKTAGVIGYENLTKPQIKEALAEARQKLAERTAVSAERVIREYARLAFVDPRSIFTWGPGGVAVKDSAELSADDAVCVLEVSHEVTEAGTKVRVKVHDKKAALEALAKHLGLFEKDKEQKGPVAIRVIYDDLPDEEINRRLNALLQEAGSPPLPA